MHKSASRIGSFSGRFSCQASGMFFCAAVAGIHKPVGKPGGVHLDLGGSPAGANGILHQLNLYAEQLEQQMTAQEFFDKKQRNRLIAKKEELYRYRRAYQASIEPLSRISMDDGVKENYAKFQNISIEDENGETYTVSLFTQI